MYQLGKMVRKDTESNQLEAVLSELQEIKSILQKESSKVNHSFLLLFISCTRRLKDLVLL